MLKMIITLNETSRLENNHDNLFHYILTIIAWVVSEWECLEPWQWMSRKRREIDKYELKIIFFVQKD